MGRLLLVAAALWTAGFLAVYLVVIRSQGGGPAWWLVGLLCAVVAALALAASGVGGLPLVAGAGVALALAMLAALLSIGLLLLPAVVAVALAGAWAWDSNQEPGGPSWTP